MGALLGLMFGTGLLLIWRSGARAPRRRSRGAPGWVSRSVDLLRQAGVDGIGSTQLLGAQVLCSLVVGVLVLALTSTLAVAASFSVFAFFGPIMVLRRMRRRRQVALRELWPEAVDNMASAVRAGMSLPEGLSALALRGPEPLRPQFARFSAAYRATGRFGDVCETMRVAREVGGSDLGTVLRTLSELLRSDARTRSELETRQGWVVNAARLAVAAPWLVLLLLGTQSTTLRAYNSTGGVVLLAVGAAVCVVAYRIMLRIGKLPEEQRVLR